jgi:single-stranded-DNA-specific exonuclease
MLRFGGHAMAAGLTIEASNLSAFEEALAAAAEFCVSAEQWQSVQWVDGALTPNLLSLYEAEQLEQLGPWGQACPTPTFINRFQVRAQQWLKGEHVRLTLGLPGSAQTWSAIWFFCPLDPATPLAEEVTFIYELQVNRFRDVSQLQLRILRQVLADTAAEQSILAQPLV